jgi:hypothetical protein
MEIAFLKGGWEIAFRETPSGVRIIRYFRFRPPEGDEMVLDCDLPYPG